MGNVYLGKRVKDTGGKGLNTLTEVKGICEAIINDYKRHKISYRTAMSRLNLLSLVVKKSNKMVGKKRKAYKIIDRYRKRLMKLRNKK